MDAELKAYLDGMMQQINNNCERILAAFKEMRDDLKAIREDLKATREDTDNTKGHVTLSQRIAKLEDDLRRRR